VNLVTAREREAQNAVGRAQVSGRRLAQRERDWLVPLGRAGYAANGLVYALIGVLAVQASLGDGGDTTDPAGALGHIVQAPFGRLLLAIVAVGLVLMLLRFPTEGRVRLWLEDQKEQLARLRQEVGMGGQGS